MQLTFVSSEISPYAKTGGLADVAGSLPKAIKKQNCDVLLVMPYYMTVHAYKDHLTELPWEYVFEHENRKYSLKFLEGRHGKTQIPVYFIRCPELFERDALYGEANKDYEDNLLRFSAFSHAVLHLHELIDYQPDVLHCNDWQTGLIPALVKAEPVKYARFQEAVLVMTVHNLSFQGIFPEKDFGITKLPRKFFGIDGLEYYDQVSTLKSGIVYSDIITTVSRKYAEEIQSPEKGCGFEEILVRRRDHLYGIINGVDTSVWDPAKDKRIAEQYSPQDLSGKAICKQDLLKTFNLDSSFTGPVLGIVSRLTEQKGFSLLKDAADELMELNLRLVILGTGEQDLENFFRELQTRYPSKVGLFIGYDEILAHKIEAGADVFLMPSRFEPSGLNQLYSLIYGTVPVVHATGGLDDTISNYSRVTKSGNGFKFDEFTSDAFLKSIREAVSLYEEAPAEWKDLIQRNMLQDYSWKASAKEYITLYREALKRREEAP